MRDSPLVIKNRLDYEDIETTLNTYGHFYPDSSFEVARKLESVIKYQPWKQMKK